jgi:hypothetical protein
VPATYDATTYTYDHPDELYDGGRASSRTAVMRGRGRGAATVAVFATTATVVLRLAGRQAAVAVPGRASAPTLRLVGRQASAATTLRSAAAQLRAVVRTPTATSRAASAPASLAGRGRALLAHLKAAREAALLRSQLRALTVVVSLELQYAAPAADLADGSWTNELASAVNLYASIDEMTASDADYIQSSLSPAVVDEVKLTLASLDDPAVDTDHVLRYRYQKSASAGDQIDLTVRLYAADGSTIIAEQVHTAIDALIDGELTLSEAEAAAIPSADYAAGLVLGFRAVKV